MTKKIFERRYAEFSYAPLGSKGAGEVTRSQSRSTLYLRVLYITALVLLISLITVISSGNDQEKWLKTKLQRFDPDLYPATNLTLGENTASKEKAGFIALVRNSEMVPMKNSIRQLESRFNRRFNYPWIFLNDEPFTEEFKREMRKMTNAEIHFGQVPSSQWSYPDWVSTEKAAKERASARYRYGHLESYRHMCRYQSGFFYRHPLTLNLDYYWRVEPGVEFWCDIDYDPFLFMKMNRKVYGFTMAVYETQSTVRTLYETTKSFIKKYPNALHKDAAIHFVTDKSNTNDFKSSEWNMCHFWSNFEIVDLTFYRNQTYMNYFDHLDKSGGFFYERWGDAPIHSLAASLFLDKSKLHFFDDIGYKHENWGHCPYDPSCHKNGKCQCNREKSFDTHRKSCMKQWKKLGI